MPGLDSKQTFSNTEAATNQVLFIPGSFETDNAAVTNVRGDGFVVTHSDTGKFLVTFSQPFIAKQMISFVASFEDDAAGAADDSLISTEPFDESTNSVLVRLAVASALTNDNGPRINFIAAFNKLQLIATTHA